MLEYILRRVVESARRGQEDVVIEVVAPPGAGKTRTVVSLVVELGLSAIMAFPTHQNQLTALTYALEASGRELRHFIMDYVGRSHYCILLNPGSLRGLAEKLGGRIRDIPSHPLIMAALTSAGVQMNEALRFYERLEELVERYGGDLETYRRRVYSLVALHGGWGRVCRELCPAGLLMELNRRRVYELLAEPRIVTPRRAVVETVEARFPWARGALLYANPAESIPQAPEEGYVCIRRLLEGSWSLTPRGRVVPVAARRSLILMPHAALRHLYHIIIRIAGVVGREEPLLYVDEYDAMLRPVSAPVLPLDAIEAEARLAREVVEAGPGSRVYGVEVDEELAREAALVEHILAQVIPIVRESIERGVHHPLADLTVEGAFSELREETLSTARGVVYRPLGPRVAHAKHFHGTELLPLILSARLPRWLEFLETVRPTVSARVPANVGGVVRLVKRRVRVRSFIPAARRILSTLLYAPRFVLHYRLSRGLRVASYEPSLYLVLSLAKRAVLTTATPIDWRLWWRGPVVFTTPDFRSVASGAVLALAPAVLEDSATYSSHREVTFRMSIVAYNADSRASLEEAIARGTVFEYRGAERKRVKILRIEAGQAPWSFRLHFAPLPPLGTDGEMLPHYVLVLSSLARRGPILALAQNKRVARALAVAMRARLVSPGGKPAYYEARGVYITWFRSRVSRGVDIPSPVRYVLICGSPYPRPTVLLPPMPPEAVATLPVFAKPVRVKPLNARLVHTAYLTLTMHDYISAVAELAQAVGRGLRAGARAGWTVTIIAPAFLARKVAMLAPNWLAEYIAE